MVRPSDALRLALFVVVAAVCSISSGCESMSSMMAKTALSGPPTQWEPENAGQDPEAVGQGENFGELFTESE